MGLIGIGIPKDSVVQYELALKTDKFLPMVHGTALQVEKARSIVASTRPVSATLHSPKRSEPPQDSDIFATVSTFEQIPLSP